MNMLNSPTLLYKLELTIHKLLNKTRWFFKLLESKIKDTLIVNCIGILIVVVKFFNLLECYLQDSYILTHIKLVNNINAYPNVYEVEQEKF